MKTFVSDLSQKTFPIAEKTFGRVVPSSVFALIIKQYPNFTTTSALAISELNEYRQHYIISLLNKGTQELSSLEETEVNSLKNQAQLINTIDDEITTRTYGQSVADNVAAFGGSWRFIILFGIFIFIWISLNAVLIITKNFDPYPFILLNLILSCVAALQAPVIMMSQNRQEEKDRERSKKDYLVNLKSELEIQLLHEKIDHLIQHQQQELIEIQQIQIEMMNDIMTEIKKEIK
jgi:uncharacterized membrane protein